MVPEGYRAAVSGFEGYAENVYLFKKVKICNLEIMKNRMG